MSKEHALKMRTFVDYFVFYYGSAHSWMMMTMNYFLAATIPVLCEKSLPKTCKDIAIFLLKIAGIMILMQLLCALWYVVIGHKMMAQFCGAICLVIYMLIFDKCPLGIKISIGAPYVAGICISMLFSCSVLDVLESSSAMNFVILVVVMYVILLSGCVAFLKALSPEKVADGITIVNIAMICVVSLVCVFYWILTNFIKIDPIVSVSAGAMLFVVLLATYAGNFFSERHFAETKDKQASAFMMEAEKNMMTVTETNLSHLRSVRHEIVNQMAFMKIFLENGEYEELKKYFDGFAEKIDSVMNLIDCGNKVFNAVLNIEIAKANEKRIKIDTKISVPKKIGIKEYDLSSLLLNLLNNAIEYLSDRPELTQSVFLAANIANSVLFVSCKNEIRKGEEAFARSLVTRKTDKDSHGYGTKVIKSIVEKYDGDVDFRTENGKFIVDAFLNEEREKEDEQKDTEV